MKVVVRIVLYVALAVLAAFLFTRFRKAYNEAYGRAQASLDSASPTNEVAATGRLEALTNATGSAIHQLTTNGVAATDTNSSPADVITNMPIGGLAKPIAAPSKADSFRYLALFVIVFLALGGLAAWDVSQYLGARAGRSVMADDWVERKDPEYEKAEEEWSKGNHLDAINMMRDYLSRNPSEQHVALRIAEIYEKDLNNFLAAALELEEVLTRKLPREKWGWTAIRLANIYSGRLNQPEKAMKVLDRIVHQYGDTGAAKKARQRLGIPEPIAASPAEAPPETGSEPPPPPPPEPDSSANLPKGFRPKK